MSSIKILTVKQTEFGPFLAFMSRGSKGPLKLYPPHEFWRRKKNYSLATSCYGDTNQRVFQHDALHVLILKKRKYPASNLMWWAAWCPKPWTNVPGVPKFEWYISNESNESWCVVDPLIQTDRPIFVALVVIYHERDPDWIINKLKKKSYRRAVHKSDTFYPISLMWNNYI
jgi:hypothetical protein